VPGQNVLVSQVTWTYWRWPARTQCWTDHVGTPHHGCQRPGRIAIRWLAEECRRRKGRRRRRVSLTTRPAASLSPWILPSPA